MHRIGSRYEINIILNDAFISNYIYCMEIYAEKYFILSLDFFTCIYPRNELNIYLVIFTI